MLRWLWDLLFTRRRWTIIEKCDLYHKGNEMPHGVRYTLQDQWGNIKSKKVGG